MDVTNSTSLIPSTSPPADTTASGREETLAQLTRCLIEAHAARGLIHLERGDICMALSDLDEAFRLDAANADAHRLRVAIERHLARVHPAQPAHGQPRWDGPSIVAELPPQPRFEAGYRVMARYPDHPGRGDDLIKSSFPLTPGGYREAVEYAKHLCADASSQERSNLWDAYLTHGEDFDAVVVEYRTMAREVHLEKRQDDDLPPAEG